MDVELLDGFEALAEGDGVLVYRTADGVEYAVHRVDMHGSPLPGCDPVGLGYLPIMLCFEDTTAGVAVVEVVDAGVLESMPA